MLLTFTSPESFSLLAPPPALESVQAQEPGPVLLQGSAFR
jgi:hypothetical protein